MVVKVKEAPSSSGDVAPAASADPLRGAATTDARVAKAKETEVEFSRLKKLVPSISKKQSVSKLDVILEAIRYIDQLQDQLVDQLSSKEGGLAAAASRFAAAAAAGKENSVAGVSESDILTAIDEKWRKRHKSE